MKKLAAGMRDDCFCWTTAPAADLLVWSRQLLLGHRLSPAFPGAEGKVTGQPHCCVLSPRGERVEVY